MIKSKSFSDRTFGVFTYVIITLMTLLCLLPLLHMVALSFSDKEAVSAGRVGIWPMGFNLEAYKMILSDQQYFRSFGVSVARVVVGTIYNIITTVLFAFPLAHEKKQWPSRNLYMLFMLFTMMFGNGGLVPWYFTIKKVGMLGTFWALVIPGGVAFGHVILLMNAMRNLPKSLRESAELDGAGYMSLLFRIYLPLTIPTLAVIVLYCVVGHWNEFFAARILIKKMEQLPLQSYIYSLRMTETHLSTLRTTELMKLETLSGRAFDAAKIVVATVPILLIYPVIQRFFVGGITLGAVKE
jgi:putative aldouronate transport system permease protein